MFIRLPTQQNHGEDLKGHGFVIWDVDKKSHQFVELHNDYGFVTVDIKDGKLQTDISNIPSKARLRVRCYESEPSEVKKIVADIKTKSDLQEVSYIRGDSVKDIKRGTVSKVPLSKLKEPEFQNTLIEPYLRHKYPKIDKKTLDKIFELNKELNLQLSAKDKVSNVKWIPKKFTFDNMFSYGEKNVINFTKMSGIQGIFASNASGKSSILSAFCFCLWDKCDKTFKAGHVMNQSKMSFKCEAVLEIDGIDYTIKRIAKRDKKGNVRVTVDFYREINGEKESLNDEHRKSTNDAIRNYIGEYEDFHLVFQPRN